MSRLSRDIRDFFETEFRRRQLRDVPASGLHDAEVATVRAGGALIEGFIRNFRFIDLPDCPSSYGGAVGMTPRVKADETGLEFVSGAVEIAPSPPTYVSGTLSYSTSIANTTDTPVTYAEDFAVGDLLLLHANAHYSAGNSPTLATPAGWTRIAGPIRTTDEPFLNVCTYAFYKLADGTESGELHLVWSSMPNPSLEQNGMTAWTGISASAPIEGLITNHSHGSPLLGNDVTTDGRNRTIVNLYCINDQSTSAHGSGWTDRYMEAGPGFLHNSLACSDRSEDDATTVPQESRVISGATLGTGFYWTSISFGIVPAFGG